MFVKIICIYYNAIYVTFSFVPYKINDIFKLLKDQILNRYFNSLLRSAMAGCLYKLHAKHTSNLGFDQTFMPCSGYILFAAKQQVGYQISWVNLQREVNCL